MSCTDCKRSLVDPWIDTVLASAEHIWETKPQVLHGSLISDFKTAAKPDLEKVNEEDSTVKVVKHLNLRGFRNAQYGLVSRSEPHSLSKADLLDAIQRYSSPSPSPEAIRAAIRASARSGSA